jgi:hypothetical protein
LGARDDVLDLQRYALGGAVGAAVSGAFQDVLAYFVAGKGALLVARPFDGRVLEDLGIEAHGLDLGAG